MNSKNYSKKFTFGKVAYTGNHKSYLVEVEVELELKQDEGRPVFTASGNVWNTMHTDIVMGGQCIDDIYKEFRGELKNRKLFEAIMALWERNHLNDMNAGCEHQQAMKWGEGKARIAKLKLNYDKAGKMQSEIEKRSLSELKLKGVVKITEKERAILNLPYWVTVPEEKVTDYPLYDVESREEKGLGWLHESEHPDGVLGKKCPKCGYEYGTAWVYRKISKADLIEICRLLDIPPQEWKAIISLGSES